MLRVRESLKLPRARRRPGAKGFVRQSFFQDLRQEFCLRGIIFCFQPSFFARFLDRGEINVRGQILFADVGEQIVADMVPEIGAQRAVGARGRKLLVTGEAVINRDQFSARQNTGGCAPPAFGGGRSLDGVAVGQDGFQTGRLKVDS